MDQTLVSPSCHIVKMLILVTCILSFIPALLIHADHLTAFNSKSLSILIRQSTHGTRGKHKCRAGCLNRTTFNLKEPRHRNTTLTLILVMQFPKVIGRNYIQNLDVTRSRERELNIYHDKHTRRGRQKIVSVLSIFVTLTMLYTR